MKLFSLILNKKPRNKLNSLPNIRSNSTKNNTSEISFNNNINNSVSITTKASLPKNNSSTFLISNKVKKLRKIKLNNSLGSIAENQFYYPHTNVNKDTVKILEKADEVMKMRNNSNLYIMEGGKNFSKKFCIGQGKEISKKNYSINLLRQKRTEVNLKSFLMDQAVKNFNTQFEKDYRDFNIFISIKEEDVLGKVIKIREKTESILKQEQSLHESLSDLLVKRVKAFFNLKKFGSFFHKLIDTPFLYNQVPDKNSETIDFEDISNAIIDIYETEEKYLELPEELNDGDLFMNKYVQLEDMVLYMIRMKRSLENEIRKDIILYNKELEQIQQVKNQYERDLGFFKDEKFLVNLELKKSSIYTYSNFDDFLEFICDLGINVGVEGNPPVKNGEDFDEFILFGKKTLQILEGMELEINKYIKKKKKIEMKEEKNKESIMKDIILRQKNINKMDFKLSFKQLQEKIKLQKDLKTIEKGRKLVLKGRLVYNYPNIKHIKKIKKVIIKEENDEDELHYSETEEEKNE